MISGHMQQPQHNMIKPMIDETTPRAEESWQQQAPQRGSACKKKNAILIATQLLCIGPAVLAVAHIFVHTISNEHGMT